MSKQITSLQKLGENGEIINFELSCKAQNISGLTDLIKQEVANSLYPVGSVYASINSTDPSTLFGGTWERFAKGRTLIGVDENDSDFSIAKKDGGLKNVTLSTSQIPSHNHSVSINSNGDHNHTTNYSGSHTHTMTQEGGHTHTTHQLEHIRIKYMCEQMQLKLLVL